MKVKDFFVKPGAVTAAEGAYAFHTVKHHNSVLSMSCLSVLVKNIVFDSKVAKIFFSARTKTEAIINSVLGPHSVSSVLKTFYENNIPYCGVSKKWKQP